MHVPYENEDEYQEHLELQRERARESDIEQFNTPAKGEKWCPADFVNG
ncbi:MAG TPA: hypothetical protein PKZ27_02915 [Rhodocyclaceae bacterium]|nr:hypothetical protein [Burkholderiaceae bacterium]HRP74517.1 hypothetical protein [Rhodocyclaceae bacterium]